MSGKSEYKYEGLSKDRKRTSIGGQALLEGILMKGPDLTSIAIRKPDGNIDLSVEETNSISSKYKLLKLPILRGIAILYDSLKRGYRALDYSASFDEEYEEEKGSIFNFLFVLLAIVLVVGIFFALPTYLVGFLRPYIGFPFILNLLEGLMRVCIFVVYVLLISRSEDIKRVFMYHGAEHKTINTYEAGEDLTVENVRKHSRLHPRCGTSFIFNLIIIGALIFSFLDFNSQVLRIVVKILSIPILVGITYELNRWMGGSSSFISKQMSKAGMFLQKIATVREPDDQMIEVAICAMEAVIPEDESRDLW